MEQGPKKDIKNILGEFFDKAIDSAKELTGKTKNTLEEAKVGEKMKRAGSVIVESSKTAGLFIYDKTMVAANVVAENPVIKNIGTKTKEGFSKATDAISNVRKVIRQK